MTATIRELIKKKKIAGPTGRNFKLDQWIGIFGKTQDEIKDSEMLRDAAVAIHQVLAEIRAELALLYTESAPVIGAPELQKYFFALSNRDRNISSRNANRKNFNVKNIFSATTNNNPAGNGLTFMEQAEGCVDGLQKAIVECSRRISEGKPLVPGRNPIEIPEFLYREVMLSQLYGIYEAYWAAILWGDYDFKWVDRSKNIAEINQKLTTYELAHEVSQIRRMRRSIGSFAYINNILPAIRGTYVVVQGAGRARKYEVRGINKASESIRFMNAKILISSNEAMNAFPKKFIDKKYQNSKVSIVDVMNVFRMLSHVAAQLIERFPKDADLKHLSQFKEFAPGLDKSKLCKAIASACDIEILTVYSIIDFLTFRKPSDDLWCQPIIEDENGKMILLTSALITPNLMRVIEHWLVKMKVDLSEKGYVFEGDLVGDVNIRLEKNKFAHDYDKASSIRMYVGDDEEEIDLIFRLGNKIIVGEAKSIVVTDSPISYYRCVATLAHAADQAQRKMEFVRGNLGEVSKRLGWELSDDAEYTFIPLVITSNNMHVGFPVSNVPVCDRAILTAYFEKSDFPLCSTQDAEGEKHVAWFEVYSDPESFVDNFEIYLQNPPQVTENAESFTSRSTNVPSMGEDSIKIVYTRLVPRELDLHKIINRHYKFPVRMDPSLEQVIAGVDIII
jgi:hypothetical protein